MGKEEQIKLLFKKNNIDFQYIDLEFLVQELKMFQGNIQKVKSMDQAAADKQHIFSHIQLKGGLIND